MKKALPYILLALLAVSALLIKRCKTQKSSIAAVDRNAGLDRRPEFLEFTDHAKCRMEAGHISEDGIRRIFQEGPINNDQSEPSAHPCPIFALEGYTASKQHLRVIFAQCDEKTKVITCMALDSPFTTHCAGVGTKYEH